MSEPLKTKGIEEVQSLRRRVKRQFSLGRITAKDASVLDMQLRYVEARIVKMKETDNTGQEVSPHG